MKGFLFIPEMAVATCRDVDPKTQTRRVMSPQPVPPGPQCLVLYRRPDGLCVWCSESGVALMEPHVRPCDYKVGERRCLLTTWAVSKSLDTHKPTEVPWSVGLAFWHAGMGTPKPDWAGKARPGRFLPNHLRPLMPVFEVVSVRAERVQDITEADAKAEGAQPEGVPTGRVIGEGQAEEVGSYRAGFSSLWDSINAERGFGWQVNPWTWAISFRKIQ